MDGRIIKTVFPLDFEKLRRLPNQAPNYRFKFTFPLFIEFPNDLKQKMIKFLILEEDCRYHCQNIFRVADEKVVVAIIWPLGERAGVVEIFDHLP